MYSLALRSLRSSPLPNLGVAIAVARQPLHLRRVGPLFLLQQLLLVQHRPLGLVPRRQARPSRLQARLPPERVPWFTVLLISVVITDIGHAD